MLARHVNADGDIVTQGIAAARRQLETRSDPDGARVSALEREVSSLAGKIKFALANAGETETAQREQQEVLDQLRARRRQLEAQVAEAKAQVPERTDPPTEQELRAILQGFGEVLAGAARGEGDAAEAEQAMSIILALTGGEVLLNQEGEARRKRGWLRGRFKLRLIDSLLTRAGCGTTAACGPEITIDFREPDDAELLADEAKALFDGQLLVKQIAKVLSKRHSRPVHRNLVRSALDHWYESRGLGRCPDGRTRRAGLEVKHEVAPPYQRLAPEVGQLAAQGLKLEEIAERVDLDRNTVANSLNFWRSTHGLPPVDGRSRRTTVRH